MVGNYDIGPYANLSRASLCEADLSGANLLGASLCEADLSGANLLGASLYGANLSSTNLSGANLSRANLFGADLSGANLSRANLSRANLYGANLSRANLYGADLSGAKLSGAVLPHFQICPEEGSFVAYKKLKEGVITLMIPEDAKRTSSLVGRKCRAEFVKVLKGSGVSHRGGEYVEGEFYYPDKYDDDIRVECTHGVHFFMTRRESEEY